MDNPVNEQTKGTLSLPSLAEPKGEKMFEEFRAELLRLQNAEAEARAQLYSDFSKVFTMVGDLKATVENQGVLFSQTFNDKKDKVLRLTGGTANDPLIALNGQVASAIQLPVTSNEIGVTVVGIFCQVYFEDSSTGAFYNVTAVSTLRFIASVLENIDTNNVNLSFNPQAFFSPLNLRVKTTFSGSQRISLSYEINGGDILRATGITPAAGDSVYFSTTVQYFSE